MQRNVNVQIVVQESMTNQVPSLRTPKKHGAHTSNVYFPSAGLRSFVEGQSSKPHVCPIQ